MHTMAQHLQPSPFRRRLAPILVLLLAVAGAWSGPGLVGSARAESSFNSGVIDKMGLSWTTGGNTSWKADGTTKRDVWSAKSGTILNSQETWVQTTLQGPARVSFYWKVSSESGYDFLKFRVNGSEVASVSGEADWTQVTYDIAAAGACTIQFAYTKDGSMSSGSDAGWVDSLTVLTGETSIVLTGLPGLPFVAGEGPVWTKDTTTTRDTVSLRSGVIGHSSTSSFILPEVPGSQTVRWYGKTSTESGGDVLRFYVDDSEVTAVRMSGTKDWTQQSYALAAGTHTLKWAYTKDGSVVTGSDTVWVDSVSIGYPPVILAGPTGGSYSVGQTLRLSGIAGGGAGTGFIWKKDGGALLNSTRLTGASTTNLVISGLLASDAGSYTLSVTNAYGTLVSSAAVVTIPVAPSITSQPVGQAVNPGQAINLSVTASGSGSISYQWRKNGSDIPGATGSTYSIASASAGDAATFTVVASNSVGSVTSSGATVVVNSAPVIGTQPVSQTLLTGSTLTLSVRVTSSVQPVTYQWKKGSTSLVDGGRISGSTSSQLTLTGLLLADAASYTVVVGNSVGAITSSAATLGVQNLNHAPALGAIADLSRLEDAAAQNVALTGITDGGDGGQTLTVTATSSNPTLVPTPTVSYTSPGSTGSLQLTSAAGLSGTATITVRVQDNGGTFSGGVDSVTRQFVVTVVAVNDTPTLNQPSSVTLFDNLQAGSGSYTNDFNVDSAGGTTYGNAVRTIAYANGKIQLTASTFNQYGAFFVNDLAPGRAVSSFNAKFRLFVGIGSSDPADGFSFNFMGENPATASLASAENGVGTGLSVGFHIYSSGNSQSPYAILRVGGVTIAQTPIRILNAGTPDSPPQVEVFMTSDHKVTVLHNGTTIFNAIQTTCTPAAGWRFGFAARTGGQYALQLIDDVAITSGGMNPVQVVGLSGITDGDGGQTLTVTATSSNPSLVPDPTVVYKSPDTTGSLILATPAVNNSGTATITVRVQDNGGTANGATDFIQRQFTVTIIPVNDPPTLAALSDRAVADNSGVQTVNLTGITDGGDLNQTLTLTATSGTPATIPTPTITYTSPASTGTLQFTPVVGTSGTVLITVNVLDSGGTANGGVNTTSRTFNVRVGPVPPVIQQAPENAIAMTGRNVSFSVVAGGLNLTYKWFKNGIEIAGATGTSLTLSNVTAASAATYRVQVFNNNSFNTYPTADAVLTVVQPPVKIAVLPTQQASFTNIVSSPGASTIQWLKNGDAISGATAQTYIIGTTQSSDSANYSALVTAGGKSFTTPAVTLRLIGGLSTLFNTGVGSTGLQLSDRAEDSHYSLISPSPVTGQAVAVVTSGTYPTPPWIAGGTHSAWISPTARLREAGSDAGSFYTYRTSFNLTGVDLDSVKIGGQFAADDTVTAVLLNGSNLLTPSGVTSNAYQNFTLTLPVTLGQDLFAQRANLGSGVAITAKANNSNATGELGEPTPQGAVNHGAIHSVWWKWTAPTNGSVTVDSAGITSIASILSVFTGSYVDQLTLVGSDFQNGLWTQAIRTVTFAVTAGTEYQISMDGFQDYVGDLQINLRFTGGAPPPIPPDFVERPSLLAGTNTLDFVVRNTADSGLDRSLTGLRVEYTTSEGVPRPIEITTQPVGGTVTFGNRKTFSVGVISGSPVTYQWYKDNVAIEGADESTLVYNKVDDSDAGSYSVRVANLNGVRVSSSAMLLVDIPLTFISQPADVAAAVRGSAQFVVRFRGNLPLSVQWQRNGSNIVGATSATLTLSNLSVAKAGRYSAIVTDRDATLTSDEAVLTVMEPPVLVQEPRDFSGIAGRDILQIVSMVDGSAPMRFRWFLNGIPLATDNSATLNLGILRETQAGSYRLIATNLAGAITSRLAQVTVVIPPSITNATPNLKVYSGESAGFSVNAGGSGTLEYQWYHGGTIMLDKTASSLSLTNLTPGNGGDFSVVVRNPYGSTTNGFKLDVYVPPVPVVSTGLDISQEFTLQPGWNAVFLNVQPTANTMQDVFGGLPISSIWRWADPKSGPQFITDQSESLMDTAKWQIFLPTNRVESFQNNLFRVFRHAAYLVKLDTNAPVTFTVVGQPGYQRQRWASDAYTLTGFPVLGDTNGPAFGDYFKPSSAHYDATTASLRAAYRLQSDGVWVPITNTNTIRAGEAYWVYTKGASSYLAPLEASFQGLTTLTYGVGAETKEFTLNFRATSDASGASVSATFSHILGDQSLPLQISEFNPSVGNEWRDLPNTYSVSYQSRSSQTIRLTAKRERIPGLNYQGIMTVRGTAGTEHLIPVIVDRDEDKVAAAPAQPFNPVGLWLGNISVTHVSEVNGLTTNYVVTLVTNIVNGVTNVIEEPTTRIGNVAQGSLPTPVKDSFEMRLILHADTNGLCQVLQQVTLLTTEAKQTVVGGNVSQTTGGDPVLISDPTLLTQFKGVALRGRDTVGRRFSSPFFPMYNTNGVPFDGELALGRTISASWALPASAPLNPFYHKYHPDHDNLDASFKEYKEEAFAVRRTVSLTIPARQGSNIKPGMGQDEIEGLYIETFVGLHRTPITVRGTFHLKRILAVGAINPRSN